MWLFVFICFIELTNLIFNDIMAETGGRFYTKQTKAKQYNTAEEHKA